MSYEYVVNKDYDLTKRDIEILRLAYAFGGRVLPGALDMTFWIKAKSGKQQRINRMTKLIKKGFFRKKETGLFENRYIYMMTDNAYEIATNMFQDEDITDSGKNNFISAVTIKHLLNEQIAFFYLRKFGKSVKRAIVKNFSKEHKHTPDLYYPHKSGKLIYVEIETSKKKAHNYIDIFTKMKQDDVKNVLYIFENEKKMQQIGKVIPIWDKVFYTHIEELITADKLPVRKQVDFLKSIGAQ